jgi:hypothetical protein
VKIAVKAAHRLHRLLCDKSVIVRPDSRAAGVADGRRSAVVAALSARFAKPEVRLDRSAALLQVSFQV